MPRLTPGTVKLLRDLQRLMKYSSHRREAAGLEAILDWHDRLPDADQLRRENALLREENATLKARAGSVKEQARA